MSYSRKRFPYGLFCYVVLTFVLGSYFAFASIQGDYGLMRRIEIEAEARQLETQLDALETEVKVYANKARRLSDEYLDLDFLDEQAREVLGYIGPNEIILR
ncbi:septum formation initiator family protein [Palleronia sp.]|uniref:FtsB family cell division protein n=1 Tax=Palleronia sp. TaxID=1940284 RepID=UPI0035C86B7F